jgi:hypothetical protein
MCGLSGQIVSELLTSIGTCLQQVVFGGCVKHEFVVTPVSAQVWLQNEFGFHMIPHMAWLSRRLAVHQPSCLNIVLNMVVNSQRQIRSKKKLEVKIHMSLYPDQRNLFLDWSGVPIYECRLISVSASWNVWVSEHNYGWLFLAIWLVYFCVRFFT